MNCVIAILFVFFRFRLSQSDVVEPYEIAPVTPEMENAASQIIDALLPISGVTEESSVPWQRLAYITDTFGPRFSGSQSLEDALSWIQNSATSDGLTVSEMPTMVPKWVRGEEYAHLLVPRFKKLHMVGLGMSIGGNATAEIFVVQDNDELNAGDNCTKAKGKIVLFNTIFTTYGVTVATRSNAAVWAAACGAKAALIRSVGPFSMQNPHTGFSERSTVPAAAISNEDAAQLQRMFNRGQAPVVQLYMKSTLYEPSPSRNLLIDLVGSERPQEYVLVSGHGDSWDIAEGAMDDGGGFMSSWEAVRVMNELVQKNLIARPKRTIRAVVWVNEENGEAGGLQYLADLNQTGALLNHSIAIETDSGAFQPWGIGVTCETDTDAPATGGGCDAARAQLQLIGDKLLAQIGAGTVVAGGGGADIEPMCSTGIPCVGLNVLDPRLSPGNNNPCTADSRASWGPPDLLVGAAAEYDSGYFFYHHSEADTMERIDPYQLQQSAAALAIWTYAVAQLPTLLPRNTAAPPAAPDNSDSSKQPALSQSVLLGIYVVAGCLLLAVIVFVVRRWLLPAGGRFKTGAPATEKGDGTPGGESDDTLDLVTAGNDDEKLLRAS